MTCPSGHSSLYHMTSILSTWRQDFSYQILFLTFKNTCFQQWSD